MTRVNKGFSPFVLQFFSAPRTLAPHARPAFRSFLRILPQAEALRNQKAPKRKGRVRGMICSAGSQPACEGSVSPFPLQTAGRRGCLPRSVSGGPSALGYSVDGPVISALWFKSSTPHRRPFTPSGQSQETSAVSSKLRRNGCGGRPGLNVSTSRCRNRPTHRTSRPYNAQWQKSPCPGSAPESRMPAGSLL